MKKIMLSVVIIIFLSNPIIAQNWIEPVNVSNMGGFNQMPDFCIDSSGIIHCVWTHFYDVNYSKIFYNKSLDDGLSWTIAQDISQNTEKRIANPHIACDSENNLHLTYDYDIGNYLESLVYYKKYDGVNWSEPLVLSENLPESHANKLVIDHNDRVYCFWFRSINNGTTYYKYLENGIWSDIFIPYNNNDFHAFSSCVVDSGNNLHWIGAHHYENQGTNDVRPIYFKYDYNNISWSNFIEISQNRSSNFYDIDLSLDGLPHCVWKEYINDSLPPDYGTAYTFYNGIDWLLPEIIVENSHSQTILIDNYNNPNIIDCENFELGSKVVHYYYFLGNWQGYIVDDNNYNGDIDAEKFNSKIYIVYEKGIYNEDNSGEIMLSKADMITEIANNNANFLSLILSPNPFNNKVRISYEIKIKNRVKLEVYSSDGKLRRVLIDEIKSQGNFEFIWDGKGLNGKEVKPGLYLVRLISGRKVLTKSVEYVK